MTDAPQAAFRALADPSRRQILLHLSTGGEMTIADVAARFAMTRAAVRKHLAILEEGRLISLHKRGRETFNRLEPEALKPVADWFGHFDVYWDDKLARLQGEVRAAADKTPVNRRKRAQRAR